MNFDRKASTGYMVNWAARLLAKAIDARLKPLGLAPAHMPVIFALAHGEELSQRALAEAAAIEQPTMAATVARMERDGLLRRRVDPKDRRSTLYSLSDLGMQLTVKVREAGQAVNEAALAGMDASARAAFMAMLATLVGNLETHLDQAKDK